MQPYEKYPLTPAEDAAYLLRRVAALILLFAMPLSALVSRRSFSILLPFGVVLLTFAFLLDMKKQEVSMRLVRFFSKPMVYVLCGFFIWLVLSLPSASFYAVTWEKVFSLSATLIFPMLGVFVLPDRTSESLVSNIGLGLALTAGCAFLCDLFEPFSDVEGTLGRVFLIMSLFVWPGCACFLLLEKRLHAAGIFLLVTLSILWSPFEIPKILLAIGVIGACFLYLLPAQRLIQISLYGVLGCIFLTPLALLLFSGLSFFLGRLGQYPIFLQIAEWKGLLFEQPLKLLVGHGLGAWHHIHMAQGLSHVFSPPFLVIMWYEMGLMGAIAHGLFMWSTFRTVREIPNEVLRGAALIALYAALTYTYVWSVADKLWWCSILGALVLVFVAIGRLQNAATPLRVTFVPQE
jgi:hypothetical protein